MDTKIIFSLSKTIKAPVKAGCVSSLAIQNLTSFLRYIESNPGGEANSFEKFAEKNLISKNGRDWLQKIKDSYTETKNIIILELLKVKDVEYNELYQRINHKQKIEKNQLSYHLRTLLERNLIIKTGRGNFVRYSMRECVKCYILYKWEL